MITREAFLRETYFRVVFDESTSINQSAKIRATILLLLIIHTMERNFTV